MIHLLNSKNGYKEYIVDEPEDIKKLPTNCDPGSNAVVVNTGEVYMLNASYEWKAL